MYVNNVFDRVGMDWESSYRELVGLPDMMDFNFELVNNSNSLIELSNRSFKLEQLHISKAVGEELSNSDESVFLEPGASYRFTMSLPCKDNFMLLFCDIDLRIPAVSLQYKLRSPQILIEPKHLMN